MGQRFKHRPSYVLSRVVLRDRQTVPIFLLQLLRGTTEGWFSDGYVTAPDFTRIGGSGKHAMSKPPIRIRELGAKKAGSRLLLKVFSLFQHIDNIVVELMSLSIGDLGWSKNRHGGSGIPDISYKGFGVFQFRCVYERHLRIYHIAPRGMTPAAPCLEYLPAGLILFRSRRALACIDELSAEIGGGIGHPDQA